MISKELLSEVIGYKVDYIASSGNTYIGFHTEMGGKNINIYELAHKCKEWALSKGYYISLIIDEDDKTKCRYVLNLSWNDGYEVDFIIASEPYSTETEAIIKACEWILDNIKES